MAQIFTNLARKWCEQVLGPRRHTERSEDGHEAHQHKDAEPSLFNIERDGDPRISWIMYYDFVVTKAEAFYELQPGYLATANYPSRVKSENIIIDGKTHYPCRVPDCTSTPFTRHYDLERHFETVHQAGEEVQIHCNCDYNRCPHKEPFRKDHCREHYQEYHAEDLITRGQPKHSKPTRGQKSPETIEDFLAARLDNLNVTWWRCCKCVRRVKVTDHGYICSRCNEACEPERVALRENARKSSNNTQAADSTAGYSNASSYVTGCGQCGNTWLPDKKDPKVWVSCPRCRQLSTTEKIPLMVQETAWQQHGNIPTLDGYGDKSSVEVASFDCWCLWYRTFPPMSLLAGFSMVALFVWSNQRMELEISSDFVQQIIAASVRAIPAQVVEASHLVPSGLILLSYLLASAIWSILTVGRSSTRLRSPCLGYGYLYILLATTFWSLLGLTAAELFLAFLPLSVSIGICLYTICGGPVIDRRTCKRCAKGVDRHESFTSIAAPSIQDPYSHRPTLDVLDEDLEMNAKG